MKIILLILLLLKNIYTEYISYDFENGVPREFSNIKTYNIYQFFIEAKYLQDINIKLVMNYVGYDIKDYITYSYIYEYSQRNNNYYTTLESKNANINKIGNKVEALISHTVNIPNHFWSKLFLGKI